MDETGLVGVDARDQSPHVPVGVETELTLTGIDGVLENVQSPHVPVAELDGTTGLTGLEDAELAGVVQSIQEPVGDDCGAELAGVVGTTGPTARDVVDAVVVQQSSVESVGELMGLTGVVEIGAGPVEDPGPTVHCEVGT